MPLSEIKTNFSDFFLMSLGQIVFHFLLEILTNDFLSFVIASYACLVKKYFSYRLLYRLFCS